MNCRNVATALNLKIKEKIKTLYRSSHHAKGGFHISTFSTLFRQGAFLMLKDQKAGEQNGKA